MLVMLVKYCCTVFVSTVMVMFHQVCIANRSSTAWEWHVWLASVCPSFQLIW